MVGGGWEIAEAESFTLAASQLGGARHIDLALAPIMDGLQHNPYGFRPTGVGGIRIAKTTIVSMDGSVIPALTVRFRLEPPHTVELLHVEISMPEEMEYSDDFPF